MSSAHPKLIDVRCIWDHAPHNAFTDLLVFRGQWLCTFREAHFHEAFDQGQIRVISSVDGVSWKSVVLSAIDGVDLRDPKLSIMPDGRLLLLVGCQERNANGTMVHATRVAFSSDAKTWSPWQSVLQKGEWLWRLTWHADQAYGISYRYTDVANRKSPWVITLFQTRDAVNFIKVAELDVSGYPCEATVRFTSAGEMIALVRREDPRKFGAWLGRSVAPYTQWTWNPLGVHLDGPDFVETSDGVILAAGRIMEDSESGEQLERTALCRIIGGQVKAVLTLPSAGDTSYPGIVLQDKILWISYYSSHESNTAIYLAKVQL